LPDPGIVRRCTGSDRATPKHADVLSTKAW
jgi:hypothetical protein